MDYFNILNLKREPFSNSPDPEFFFGSHQHVECLQKLELALRLRRGLNVVLGEVGTGKTTLCRQLIRRFDDAQEFETHLVLDPDFSNSTEFLATITKLFTGKRPAEYANDWQLKEFIKQYLFRRGVDQMKTVILIIDEGQKLPSFCLELLREFLNYETNDYKLLQIVIFAQKEFEAILQQHANFTDRINLLHFLKPLGFKDTRAMINYRLEKSSSGYESYRFFTLPALAAIYIASRGYPRKIINLCHRCILTMIVQNRTMVDLFLARTCIQRVFPGRSRQTRRLAAALVIPLLILAVGFSFLDLQGLPKRLFSVVSRNPVTEAAAPSRRKIDPLPAERVTVASAAPVVNLSQPTLDVAAVPAPATETQPAAPTAEPETTASIERPASGMRLPEPLETIGRITLNRNETLSGLILSVYGEYNSRYFKTLILANPQIEDPDLVRVGQQISLPAIPAAVRPAKQPTWWIRLDRKSSLEAAYRYLRELPPDAPVVRMVPHWSSSEGLQFDLVLDRYFLREDDARRQLALLSNTPAARAEVVSIWSAEGIYYADPFFGHRRIGSSG
jgi:general secretion pathway protein A